MKVKCKITLLIISIIILIPLNNVVADECDNDYKQAKQLINSAQKARTEKNYELAAEYYENAAEYFERIADRGKCWCPKILKAAPSNAKKYYQVAAELRKYSQEIEVHEEYNRAVEICREGHNYARKREYESAIQNFEQAVEIWEQIGENTNSQYYKQALTEAAKARKAANLAREYLDK